VIDNCKKIRILLLSPYDSMSHQYWRNGLKSTFSEYQWHELILPPRYFNWRVRSNSLTWSFLQEDVLSKPYDLLIATSMTDLATLRGIVPALTRIPTILYFHENQFAYPGSEQSNSRLEAKMVSLYSALSADYVVFNSEYNRTSFLHGLNDLLKKMPDCVPPGIGERIFSKSKVLPVPLIGESDCGITKKSGTQKKTQKKNNYLTLLWNHRWEYDKAPERFFAALLKLKQSGCDFNVHVVGQKFRQHPVVFDEYYPLLKNHISSWGMTERDHYNEILSDSDVVISTALHDFQGLAVLEAVAAGCVPLVPDRLAYKEYINEQFRYPSCLDDPDRESTLLVEELLKIIEKYKNGGSLQTDDVSRLTWDCQKEAYKDLFEHAIEVFLTRSG